MRMIKSVICVALAFMIMGVFGTAAAEEETGDHEVQFVSMALQESESYVRADITIDGITTLYEFEEQNFTSEFATLKVGCGHGNWVDPAVIDHLFDSLGLGIREDPNGLGIWEDPNGLGIWEDPNGLGIREDPNGLGIREDPN